MNLTTYDYVYIISNIITAFTAFKFMSAFFDRKDVKLKYEIITYIAYYLFITAAYLFINLPLLMLIANVIAFLGVSVIYPASWKKRIFSSGIMYIILMAVEIAISVWFGYVGIAPTEKSGFTSIWGILVLRLVSYLVAEIASKFGKGHKNMHIPIMHWAALLTIPIASIYVMTIIMKAIGLKTTELFISTIVILLINFTVFYLYDAIQNAYQSRMDKILLQNQTVYYEKQMETMENSLTLAKVFKHDLNNHFSVLLALAEKNDVEEIKKYITNMQQIDKNKAEYSNSGDVILDSILNFKLANAQNKNIKINLEVELTEPINILPIDLAAMLGNLIDNAITATNKLPPENRYIDLSVKTDRARLIVSIKNSYDGSLNLQKNKILTTKPEIYGHGFGLTSIKNTIDKYDGIFNIKHDNNEFDVVVIMYLPKNTVAAVTN